MSVPTSLFTDVPVLSDPFFYFFSRFVCSRAGLVTFRFIASAYVSVDSSEREDAETDVTFAYDPASNSDFHSPNDFQQDEVWGFGWIELPSVGPLFFLIFFLLRRP